MLGTMRRIVSAGLQLGPNKATLAAQGWKLSSAIGMEEADDFNFRIGRRSDVSTAFLCIDCRMISITRRIARVPATFVLGVMSASGLRIALSNVHSRPEGRFRLTLSQLRSRQSHQVPEIPMVQTRVRI